MKYKLTIRKKGFIPVTIEEIEKFEVKIGYKLPNEYKEFLLLHNGCKTGSEIFKFECIDLCDGKVRSEEFWLEEFESIQNGLLSTGVWEDEYIPERKYIVVSDFGDGSLITLSLNKETYGQIYWVDCPHEGYYYKISNNFTEFLEGFIHKPWDPYNLDYDNNGNFIESD